MPEPSDRSETSEPSEPLDQAATLAAWLTGCLGRPVDADALDIDRPSSGGWSNETWLVGTGLDDPARVVVRLQPDRPSMFPTYDLGRQLACLDTLGRDPDVPVPRLLGTDPDGRWFGRPGFIMEHVAGRVPRDDRPTFAEAGFLHDASPAEQRRFFTSFLDALVTIHRADPQQPGLAPLHPSAAADGSDTDSNTAAMADLRRLWEWDRGERWPTEIDEVIDRLAGEVPAPTEDVLLWGDARPANVIVATDGFEPVALIDWELATIGSPEHDLTWFLEMNHMRIGGAGLAPLPGFLTDAEAADHYRERSGRTLDDLGWYRRFAAAKVAVLMHRYLRAMVHAERLAPDHKLFASTVASRRLAELVD